jgi:hypothetical protein
MVMHVAEHGRKDFVPKRVLASTSGHCAPRLISAAFSANNQDASLKGRTPAIS